MWTFVPCVFCINVRTVYYSDTCTIFSLWNSIVEPFLILHRGCNKCPEGTCDNFISLEEIHPDKFCDRQIMELKCFCSNRGCKTQICLKDLEVSVCNYA